MSWNIDEATWRKDRRFPSGPGWDQRRPGTQPSRIVIHTTNGNAGSSFAGEATFLRDSQSVSAHYLVGKAGQMAMLLPPEQRAWHTGQAKDGWDNNDTIGIECHHAENEQWTVPQREALTWLVRQLMTRYAIPAQWIETHRFIALPAGRKTDPSDWPDADFYAWRNSIRPEEFSIAGAEQSYRCSEPIYRFYERYGLLVCGYPLDDEFERQDVDGEKVRYMPFENLTVKYKPSLPTPWDVRPALFEEAASQRQQQPHP